MKKYLVTLILIISLNNTLAQNLHEFSKFFINRTMRFDFTHAGNHQTEQYFFNKIVEEQYYAGSKINLLDTNYYGNQYLKIFDVASGELIYSRGYCTLFNEWQTIPEAREINKSYAETVVFPYPKESVRLEIHKRDVKGDLIKAYQHVIDPSSYLIQRYNPQYHFFDVLYSTKPENAVDIVLLAEGYTTSQREKFNRDCINFVNALFSYEPFKSRKDKFNVRGVWSPSKQEGVTIPEDNIWKQTVLGSSFYTFNSERYLMIDDLQTVRDVASAAPYDYIYILANTPKYGGGGVYNFYGISAAAHPDRAGQVYTHEFGHLLMGLGDEYQGDAEYSDMYPTNREPWEENLTTLTDFDDKLWNSMLNNKTPVPTPKTTRNETTVGVYEGAGYVDKGVYRPYQHCMMRDLKEFCPVCQASINKMIDFLIK